MRKGPVVYGADGEFKTNLLYGTMVSDFVRRRERQAGIRDACEKLRMPNRAESAHHGRIMSTWTVGRRESLDIHALGCNVVLHSTDQKVICHLRVVHDA